MIDKRPLTNEELYEVKELCVKLGECTVTYYLVLLIGEIERLRLVGKEPKT